MQYSTAFLALLSGALAIPTMSQSSDDSVRVTLAGADELATQTAFTAVQLGLREIQQPVGSSGPFQTVNLEVGKGVKQQNLRCQILNEDGMPITVLRKPNVDTTFSDADKGEWKLEQESLVSAIICDPAFVAMNSNSTGSGSGSGDNNNNADTDITVILSGADELATQTPFLLAGVEGEVQLPVGSSGPFNTVELVVGAGVQKQDLRCRVHDNTGKPITVKRNKNVDTTFSDADKGPWAFLDPVESEVLAIVCDPLFVAAPAPTL